MHEPADTGCQSLILLAFLKISNTAAQAAAQIRGREGRARIARAAHAPVQSLANSSRRPVQLADIEGGTVGAVARSRVISE